MSRTLDELIAQMDPEDRRRLMRLCDEYLQEVLGCNRVILSMLAHPESWGGATWKEDINTPSLRSKQLQKELKEAFAQIFASSREDAARVFAFMTGRFDV